MINGWKLSFIYNVYQKSKIIFYRNTASAINCYISSQNREFSDRLEFLLSVSKSLQIISIAQQSLSNIKQKKTNDFKRSGKKTKSDVITYFTAARTTPQQCVFPAVVWRTPLKPQDRLDSFIVRPQISKHKDHTQKIKNTMQNNQE